MYLIDNYEVMAENNTISKILKFKCTQPHNYFNFINHTSSSIHVPYKCYEVIAETNPISKILTPKVHSFTAVSVWTSSSILVPYNHLLRCKLYRA